MPGNPISCISARKRLKGPMQINLPLVLRLVIPPPASPSHQLVSLSRRLFLHNLYVLLLKCILCVSSKIAKFYFYNTSL